MAQGQDIFKVFVPKKDGIILTPGKKVKELKPGEMAIFNVDTNLSVADFTAGNRFYFAINQGGKIVKSPNRWIDKDNVRGISIQEPVASVNKKVTFKGFKIFCGQDYAITLSASNMKTKFEVGVNNSQASLVASSKDCTECGGDKCQEINPIPVVYELLRNASKSEFVTVNVIARANITGVPGISGTVNAGTVLTEAQLKLINTFNLTKSNPDDFVKVDFVFEAKPLEKDTWKEGHLYPRETEFYVRLSDSFIGNGALAVATATKVEVGSGFDIKHLEFTTQNTEYRGARYSNFGNVEFHPESFADANEKYTQISFRYGHKTEVTSHLYDHFSEVLIAIPSTSNIAAFKTALQGLSVLDGKIGL